MLRDTRRDEAYFKDWTARQFKRIAQFSQKLEQFRETDSEKANQCHLFISGFLRDMFYAQYSAGETIESLRETSAQYLSHLHSLNTLNYSQALTAFSVGILCDIPDKSIFSTGAFPEDQLLNALAYFCRFRSLPQEFTGDSLFPELTDKTVAFLKGTLSLEVFRTFIRNDWYQANREEPWYNSDMRNDGTYCGYWCFSGATAAVIKGCTQRDFQGVEFFPIDMLPA